MRGLRGHLVRLLLTALVVVLGVAFVCGVQLLSDTMRQGFAEVFSLRYSGTDVVVRSPDSLFTFTGQQRAPVDGGLVGTVRQTDGVRAASGVVQAPIRLLGRDGRPIGAATEALGLSTFGLNWIEDDRLNQWRTVEGHQPSASDEVVIDQRLSSEENLRVGDELRIPFASGTLVFRIVGIARFQTNPDYSGSSAVLFETATAQHHLVGDGLFSWIAASAEPGISPTELRSSVQRSGAAMGKVQVLTGTDFTKEDRDLFQQLIGIVNAVLVIFGFVSLFVSSFVIYNTFSLIIAQRGRELALLRAFGARRRQVVLGVLAEALTVGVAASAVGVLAGAVFATLISRLLETMGFLPTNPSLVFSGAAFLPGFLMGVAVTLTAGLFPAIRASRVPPVAALRELQVERGAYSHSRVFLGALLSLGGIAVLWSGLTGSELTRVAIGMASVFLGIAVLAPLLVSPAGGLLGAIPAATSGVTGVLAKENARRNPKRTAATTSAIMVGVALVTFIAIIGESFRTATAEAVDLAVRGEFVVNAPTVGLSGVSPKLTEELNRHPDVQAAASFRVGVAVADGRPTLIFGVDPSMLSQVVTFDVPQGSMLDLGTDGIAVATRVADRNHLSVGSPLRLHFQGTIATPTAGRGPPPAVSNDRILTVKAIYDSELLRGSPGMVISHELFEIGFPAVQQTDLQTYVKLKDGVPIDQARRDLQPVVERFPPAELLNLTEFKKNRTAPIDRVVTFIWALLLLAVLISAIGIINTLMLSIHERTKELGMLRVAGMSRSQLRRSVRWEALIISIMGTVLGLSIGVIFGWAFVRAAAEEGLRTFAVPTFQLVIVVMLAGLIGVIAAMLPARHAANLDLLEAIAAD